MHRTESTKQQLSLWANVELRVLRMGLVLRQLLKIFLKKILGPWHNPDLWGFDVSDIWDPSCFALRPSSITSYVTRTLHLGNRLCFRLQVQTYLVHTLGRTNLSQCDWDCGKL